MTYQKIDPIAAVVSAVLILLCLVLGLRACWKKREDAHETAIIHQIGDRIEQQDSCGIEKKGDVLLAVVADGMCGLRDGAMVSSEIVYLLLQEAKRWRTLYESLLYANEKLIRKLGADRMGQCGSTVVAVSMRKDTFEWVSVGDSRIMLFRKNRLIPLNMPHNLQTELLYRGMEGELDLDAILSNPKGRRITSYIGMGPLRSIGRSVRPIRIIPGDMLLLLSDGIFQTVTVDVLENLLRNNAHPDEAAAALEQYILSHKGNGQDNFTAVIVKPRGTASHRRRTP